MAATTGWSRLIDDSASSREIISVEPTISANSIVACLRSPCGSTVRCIAVCGAPHHPQKRAPGSQLCPQAAQMAREMMSQLTRGVLAEALLFAASLDCMAGSRHGGGGECQIIMGVIVQPLKRVTPKLVRSGHRDATTWGKPSPLKRQKS